jgi:hypothetical protein
MFSSTMLAPVPEGFPPVRAVFGLALMGWLSEASERSLLTQALSGVDCWSKAHGERTVLASVKRS